MNNLDNIGGVGKLISLKERERQRERDRAEKKTTKALHIPILVDTMWLPAAQTEMDRAGELSNTS